MEFQLSQNAWQGNKPVRITLPDHWETRYFPLPGDSRPALTAAQIRERLEQHLWNFDYAGGSNVIDVYIRYLRRKIDEGYDEKLIHTVRGAGYVLRAEKR